MSSIGISLGCTCDSAIFGVENKLRGIKATGYKTCPFDEMLSNYPGLIECLKDDFKYFCDPYYLSLIETSDGQFIFNKKYKFAFNHESPGHDNLYIKQEWPEGINHFVNNNFTNFIKRYTKRIQAFRDYLLTPNNFINFILQRYNTYQSDLNELREALKINYPYLQYQIHVCYIDGNRINNILKMLQLDDDDPEVYRLQFWFG